MKNNHTSLPIIIFIISTIVGVGIVTLPRQTAAVVGQPNMWMSVILGAGIAFINAIFLFMLIKRFPMKTVFDIGTELTGKWIGKGINLIFVTYMIAISSYIIRTMAEIVNYYLLDNTPKFVVLLVLVVSCMYLVSSGLSNIILFFQLYFPIILFMFFVLTLLSIKNIEPTHLRPIFYFDGIEILKGAHTTFFSFVGYELIMVLSGKFTFTKWKPTLTIFSISIGSVCVIYVLFFILNIGVLSIEELKVITFPTIEMAKAIEFQGFFFERFELLFLFGWIITIFTTLAAYYYSAVLGMRKAFQVKNTLPMNIMIGFIILMLSLLPSGITELFSYGTYVNYLSYTVLIALPLLLLVLSFRRGTAE